MDPGEKRKKYQSKKNRCAASVWIGGLLGILILVMSVLCSCEKTDDPAETKELKPVIVGIDNFKPYSYLDEHGTYTGVDVELATLIFRELGYEPEFRIIPWSEKNTYLENGTIDCIWSCYSMNGREEDYQWAGPYLYSRQVIAVRSDSDIETFEDLAGKRVGVQATTKAAGLFLHTIDSALPEVGGVNCFATTEDMFAALRKGYVSAISGHEALISELIEDGDGEYRLLEDSPLVSEIGAAFEKGTHVELTQQIDNVIKRMSGDGTIGRIAAQYGLEPEKVVVRGETDEK